MNEYSYRPYPYPSPARDGALSTATASCNATTPPPSRHCGHRRHTTTTSAATLKMEDEIYGDPIKCTGKSCKSCTAGVIADCVAVCCCCPCAVVNILVFAFLKVPWMVGRRILKLRKKKKCLRGILEEEEWGGCGGLVSAVEGISRKGRAASASRADGVGAFSEFELPAGGLLFGGDDENGEQRKSGNFSAWLDAEQQLWFELHQVGHLGFGRVSFTGIPIHCS